MKWNEERSHSSTTQRGFGSVVVFTMAKPANGVGICLSPFFDAHEQDPPQAKEDGPPHPYSLLPVSHEQTIHREKHLFFSFNLIEVT